MPLEIFPMKLTSSGPVSHLNPGNVLLATEVERDPIALGLSLKRKEM